QFVVRYSNTIITNIDGCNIPFTRNSQSDLSPCIGVFHPIVEQNIDKTSQCGCVAINADVDRGCDGCELPAMNPGYSTPCRSGLLDHSTQVYCPNVQGLTPSIGSRKREKLLQQSSRSLRLGEDVLQGDAVLLTVA